MKKTGCRIEFSRYRVRTTHTVGLAPWIDATAAGLRSFLNVAHFSNRVQVIGRTNGKCQMIQSRLHTHICFFGISLSANRWRRFELTISVARAIRWAFNRRATHQINFCCEKICRRWRVSRLGDDSSDGKGKRDPTRAGSVICSPEKNFNRLRLIIVCRRARAI